VAYLILAVGVAQTNPVMGFFRTYVHRALMAAAAVIGIVVAVRSRATGLDRARRGPRGLRR
jgi:hypothetical protein